MKSKSTFLVAAQVGSVLTVAGTASGQFLSPKWDRPADAASAQVSRTTFQVFDLMQDDDGDPTNGISMGMPDAANINPVGNASLSELSGSAFITGSGNIYSPFARLDMRVTIPLYTPGEDAVTRFFMQIQTEGSELVQVDPGDPTAEPPIPPSYDFSSFSINGKPLDSLVEFQYIEISRLPTLGSLVRHAFEFAVRSPVDELNTLAYRPLETSNSQQLISIDTLSTTLGDFDYDGDRDAFDIDLLLRAEAGPTCPAVSLFDLNEDGLITNSPNVGGSDADLWVRSLADTEYGDADLDGKVDFIDLLAVARAFGSVGTWANGDFNGDDLVDFGDLLLLAKHYGFGAVDVGSFTDDWTLAQTVVPEPAVLLASVAMIPLLGRRARR